MTLLARWLTSAVVATLPSIASAQIGPEFPVNTYTISHQARPAVAIDSTGNFVVVWTSGGQSGGQDGDFLGVFGRRHDSVGSPLGTEFQVNTYTTSDQSFPDIANDGAGNFVVVWTSDYQDGGTTGIFAKRYDSTGTPLTGEFQVNTHTTGFQGYPSVAVDGAGSIVVAWHGSGGGDAPGGVFGQRYDSAGSPLGGEFSVNTYTTGGQARPAVAADGAGNFVVVWESQYQDGSSSGVFGQLHDSTGNPLGGEFQVNTYITNFQGFPAVAADGSGSFIVVWMSIGQDGDAPGIFGQRYDSAGASLGGEFQVNTYTTGVQSLADVAADGAGNFVVTWTSGPHADFDEEGVFAQRFDATGDPVGGEFLVNTHNPSNQRWVAAAANVAGRFVLAWESQGQDGDLSGIFGQRYDFAGRQTVRGARLKLSQRASGQRAVTIRGSEAPSSSTIVGDPLTYGATLRVIAHGDDDQDQTFSLPPGASAPDGVPGWKLSGVGWKYSDRLGVNGPVRSASIRRFASRGFAMKVLIRGTASTPPPGVGLVPPGNGTDGGLLLTILDPDGASYCVNLGGANGGTVSNSPSAFVVRSATTETECPSP